MMSIGLNTYFFLVACIAAQRLLELRVASRNTEQLLAMGAREHESPHYTVMKLLHTTWLIACIVEAAWRGLPAPSWLALPALALFGVGQALRFAAIKGLGNRWTTRIIVLPEAPPVAGGIYRYIKHPNYLGVILELAALPLVFGCWFTAVAFSLANLALLLGVRIPAEEAALQQSVPSLELANWARMSRFVPGRISP